MKILSTLVSALIAFTPATLLAQATPSPASPDAKKEAPKAAPPKDAKATPPKDAKATPPKADPKKAPPKKMKVTTMKDGKVTTTETTAPAPLRDKNGNLIPTDPDAYDVSSATTPAPKAATPPPTAAKAASKPDPKKPVSK
jgi:hypothetical protein